MSDELQPPIVITDKREQKRLEAKERARRMAEEAEHPSADGTEPAAETIERLEQTETQRAMDRIDRMHQLTIAGRERDLTEDERSELLALQAEEEQAREEADAGQADAHHGLTAFVVLVGHDGSARALTDLNENFVIDREATVDDMYSGSSLVLRDINAAMASKHTVFGLQVSAQAMQQQAQTAAMLQRVNGAGLGGRRPR